MFLLARSLQMNAFFLMRRLKSLLNLLFVVLSEVISLKPSTEIKTNRHELNLFIGEILNKTFITGMLCNKSLLYPFFRNLKIKIS